MTFFEILLFLGNTPGANLLTTIFGSTTNRYYESTGEYLYIRFTSDNAVEKSGFSLQYFSLFSTGKITFTLIILLTCTCIVNNVNLVGSEKNFPDFSKKKYIYTRKHIVYSILKTRFWSFNYEIIFRNKYIIILLYPSNIIRVIIVFQATRQTVFFLLQSLARDKAYRATPWVTAIPSHWQLLSASSRHCPLFRIPTQGI